MNDLDLCLEVVSRSCQPLRHIRCWISRKPLEIVAWLQRTTNRKWPMGYQMVTWPMTSCDPKRCCEAVRSAILAKAWLLVRRSVCVSCSFFFILFVYCLSVIWALVAWSKRYWLIDWLIDWLTTSSSTTNKPSSTATCMCHLSYCLAFSPYYLNPLRDGRCYF